VLLMLLVKLLLLLLLNEDAGSRGRWKVMRGDGTE
jgi:hypothetical protein